MNRRTNAPWRAGTLVLGMAVLLSTVNAQTHRNVAANPGTTGLGPMGTAAFHAGEYIYTAAEIGTDMTITDIRFSTSTTVAQTFNNVNVYMQTTLASTLTTGTYSLTGYTLVYSGPFSWTATAGFAGVTLNTPFVYTTAAGNLQVLIERLDGVTHAGVTFHSANGNNTGAALTTCRRFNGAAAPVPGVSSLGQSAFRAAIQLVGTGGTCTPAFPEDLSNVPFTPSCYETSHGFCFRSPVNGYAAVGTGSVAFLFFSAPLAHNLTWTTPTFTPFGVTKQLNFDVAGATFTLPQTPDQIILEASVDGGATWTVPIATLDNGVTGSLNPTGLAQGTGYAPTLAAQWATRSFSFPGTVNRIRWRGISAFGNNVYLDNFNVTDPPACPTPTDVAISNATGFNADVSWNCVACTGQYYVEYGAPGFTPGTTAAPGAGTVSGPFASTSATITVAAGRTNYDVYVRQDCGGGVFSANTPVESFLSGCGAALACDYTFHLTDNFGDGWNGALIEVQEEGITLGTLTMEAPAFPCDRTMTFELCHDSALALVATAVGTFPDEPGLTITDPFAGIVYEFRGTTFYAQPATSGCLNSYPNPAVPTDLVLGTIHGSTVDCVQDPCIDPPTAGTLTSDVSTVCSTGGTVNLTYGGGTSGIGQTIAWESSPDGITWSPIPAAANLLSYADSPTDTTYYQVIISCGLGSDTSNVLIVNATSFACYCAATHSFGCDLGNLVNVTLNTLNNTTTCSLPAYTAYPPATGTTTTVEQGVSYNLSVTTDQSCIISIWADWDHNNVYDPSEWTQVTLNSPADTTAATVTFQVPLTATLGATNIRIRSRFAGNANGPTNACGNFGSGETEDYIINVDPAPPCLPATAVTISNVSQTAFDVNWTNGANSCGTATYTVEYGPAGFVQGTGTSLAPVTTGPVSITGLTAATDYDVYVTRDCTPCGDGLGVSVLSGAVTYPDCALAAPINCPSGVGSFGPNSPGGFNFVEPLFGFTTVGAEQLFLLDANVLGTYTMTLTAAVNSSIVAIYIKPVGACDATGWTYVNTNQFTVQTFTFPIGATGQYWVLVDPVSSSLPINTYGVTFVCPVQNIDCATAETLTCGVNVQSSTAGLANTLPVNACPYPIAPSTGGSVWYTYTPTANEEVTLSTCGIATFDTRISVYKASPDCNNLECVALNDDGAGCPDFSSEVAFPAFADSTYYIVVHGFGADEGTFQMNMFCAPPCTPASTNDLCSQAAALTPALDDGSGVATGGDNSCAYGDATTTCDPFGVMQGVWYSFNSGTNTIMFLDLGTNQNNLGLSAANINYALFDGGCSGLGALGELDCVVDAYGSNTLPTLTTNTDYLLYVWNDGGLDQGTFDVLLRRPAMNDAAIDAILSPTGTLCNTSVAPVVTLRNNGENTLTSATITFDFDGGTPVVFNWTGSLAYQATEDVTLSTITTTTGLHTLNVSVSLPNGQADEIAANNAQSLPVNITGESLRVVIATDNNGDQISWQIDDEFYLMTPVTGGPYPGQNNTVITTDVCLPIDLGNTFRFKLTDSGGDGLCCLAGNGYWELRTLSNGLLLRDEFSNTSGSNSPSLTPALPFYTEHEVHLPPGASPIQASECNIFTNTLQSKVYTTAVAGVLNYQFEFSNPDAGFYRRISLPRNWVAFNEMVTSPLTPGVRYFARARADQGASGYTDDRFSTGCEMGIDPNQVPGCTGLIDNISLPTHSCGVTKPFGGSAKVWAQPVLGATQYRFRFENAGEGYSRNIVKPSYICLLSWVTFPLQNGSTYDVSVEVFVNGVWGGFCGPVCQVTIVNPPAQGQQGRTGVVDAIAESDVELYPNPVRDGLAQLRLNGMSEGDHAIAVEVFDSFGKRVMSQQYRTSGDRFNTVLELNSGISRGLYIVNITVDGHVTTKRLSVM